jgi:fused signal recognition particle receptor
MEWIVEVLVKAPGVTFGVLLVVTALLAWRLWGNRRVKRQITTEDVALQQEKKPTQRHFFEALTKTRSFLTEQLSGIFSAGKIDEDMLESLEELLLMADIGLPTTTKLLDDVREAAKQSDEPINLQETLRKSVVSLVSVEGRDLPPIPGKGPLVLMMVGVNGSGKTTTIGKLAARYVNQGHKVILGAADTFRAGAADQLKVWAGRVGADIVAHDEGADPGAVVFDTISAAIARGCDVVIIDTAGRLQTKKPLMAELTKLHKVAGKLVENAPHNTLLVVDGTSGQNAMSQAAAFHDATKLDGVVVTKLDGTAKGGVVLAIASEMGLPIKFVGLGESVDDLVDFDPIAFADALF